MGLDERFRKLFPPIRWGTGIPPCLVSDTKVFAFSQQVDEWLPLFSPLGLAESVNALQFNPIIDQITADVCEKEARQWGEDNHVRDIFLAMDRLLRTLGEFIHKKGPQVQIAAVVKTLPVLGALFWSPQGRRILPQVAQIFGCDVEAPAGIIDYYLAAIESGDEQKLLQMRQLIDSDPVFGSWTKEFSGAATNMALPESPSPLQFTSLVSSSLLRALESEGENDSHRGDNSTEKVG